DCFCRSPNAESVVQLTPLMVQMMFTVESRLLLGCTLLPLAGPLTFLQENAHTQTKAIIAITSLFISTNYSYKINAKTGRFGTSKGKITFRAMARLQKRHR